MGLPVKKMTHLEDWDKAALDEHTNQLRLETIPTRRQNRTTKELCGFASRVCKPNTQGVSDGLPAYKESTLRVAGIAINKANHSQKKWVCEEQQTCGKPQSPQKVERVWRTLDRFLGIASYNLQKQRRLLPDGTKDESVIRAYFNEFEFKFNHRLFKGKKLSFEVLVRELAEAHSHFGFPIVRSSGTSSR